MVRALVHAPSVVFADEPTGSVHHGLARGIRQLLYGYCQEAHGCVTTTHDARPFTYADRVYVLADGMLAEGAGETSI